MSVSDVFFCDVVENALLHLYLSAAESERFIPKVKRNEMLVRYLKPMMKDKRYQQIKKEIKILVAVGRKVSGDLEAKLVELYAIERHYDQQANDAQRLFDLLTIIDEELRVTTQFLNLLGHKEPQPNVIYMLQEHVENGFIASGEQVAPVSLFIESDKVVSLVAFINDTGMFLAEIRQHNQEAKQGHIVLHPIKKGR